MTPVSDDENPMLLKKTSPTVQKGFDLLFREVPTSIHPGEGFVKATPVRTTIKRFLSGLHPVIRVKDLNNPDGDDDGRKARPAVEVGVGGTF